MMKLMKKMKVEYAYTSHIGRVRDNNEDNFWCCGKSLPTENQGTEGIHAGCMSQEELPLLAVFDGMGGESCGEEAAGLASAICGSFYQENKSTLKSDPEKYLQECCRAMNHEVCRYSQENKIQSMGSTAAILTVVPWGIWHCNLGDSRIYRMHEGELTRLSQEHVLGGGLFGKAPLMQYLGLPEEEMLLEPAIGTVDEIAGDRFLLCTDGVTDMLTDREISEILSGNTSVEDTAAQLLNLALEKGGRDNTTLVVCGIKEDEPEHPAGILKHLIALLFTKKNRGDQA